MSECVYCKQSLRGSICVNTQCPVFDKIDICVDCEQVDALTTRLALAEKERDEASDELGVRKAHLKLLVDVEADLTAAMKVVEAVESVLGAYVLPTLCYIRVKYAFHNVGYQEVDDLLAKIQEKLMPYRSETEEEPKTLPGTPTTVEIIEDAIAAMEAKDDTQD